MKRLWPLVLIILLLANVAGFGLIYWRLEHLPQFPFAALQSTIQAQNEMSAKLDGLQGLLAKNGPSQTAPAVLGLADLLPDKVQNSITPPTTFVSVIKNTHTPVPVYKEQAEFSAQLGQLIPDYKYSYYTKVNDWYLVSLTDGKTGWVKADAVSEIP